jgi:hypothetical protein
MWTKSIVRFAPSSKPPGKRYHVGGVRLWSRPSSRTGTQPKAPAGAVAQMRVITKAKMEPKFRARWNTLDKPPKTLQQAWSDIREPRTKLAAGPSRLVGCAPGSDLKRRVPLDCKLVDRDAVHDALDFLEESAFVEGLYGNDVFAGYQRPQHIGRCRQAHLEANPRRDHAALLQSLKFRVGSERHIRIPETVKAAQPRRVLQLEFQSAGLERTFGGGGLGECERGREHIALPSDPTRTRASLTVWDAGQVGAKRVAGGAKDVAGGPQRHAPH